MRPSARASQTGVVQRIPRWRPAMVTARRATRTRSARRRSFGAWKHPQPSRLRGDAGLLQGTATGEDAMAPRDALHEGFAGDALAGRAASAGRDGPCYDVSGHGAGAGARQTSRTGRSHPRAPERRLAPVRLARPRRRAASRRRTQGPTQAVPRAASHDRGRPPVAPRTTRPLRPRANIAARSYDTAWSSPRSEHGSVRNEATMAQRRRR